MSIIFTKKSLIASLNPPAELAKWLIIIEVLIKAVWKFRGKNNILNANRDFKN